MRIAGWEIRERGETAEISADVDGFRLWYRIPLSVPYARTADPFAAAALLPAMLQGGPLEIAPDLPLSPKLLENLRVLQDIHHCWNPLFQIVPIEAATAPAAPFRDGSFAFFSGGVDSTYTFLKRRSELTHLVFIQGFDFFANAGASGGFAEDDLADLSLLALRLMEPASALASHLKDSLGEDTRKALADYRATGVPAPGLEARLARDLEAVIAGPPLWDAGRFAGTALRPETKALLEEGRPGVDAYRLNRMLLEDAYPLEIARRDDTAYRTAVDRNARFARSHGKTLLPVSTNHYAFGYRYNLSRNLTQGSALASIALLLGFPRVFAPAAYSYGQLFPLGQHPLTDPLWSNEIVQIIHEGAEARRVDKIARIAEDGPALANLRVCFDDMNSNCGRCSKCLRTTIPLGLLGATGGPFPPLPPLKAIRKMRIASDIESVFLKEILDPAFRPAARPLYRALKASIRRFELQRLLRDFDKVVLGGRIRKAYMRRAGPPPGIVRIDTTPPG